ncbi:MULTISPECIES: hypothetical protein, partial [Serratia]|uniref:hypothetical protein n=1 Tax=Serratia TaxID=613 RepID=UPI001AEF57AB
LSIELRSIIRPKGLTLRASAEALFNAAQAPVVRVRSPYSEKPALGLVFCFLEYGLFIELRSIIRPKASPCGPALKRCSTRRLETNRMPYIKQSSLYIEKVARVEQQAQISATVISTSMRSPPFRYSTLVQLPLRRGGSCTKINFL